MNDDLNVMPSDLKLGQKRVLRMRWWVIVCLLGILANLSWVSYHYFLYARQKQVNRVHEDQKTQVEARISSLSQATRQLKQWETRLLVLDELRRFPDYSLITGFLAQYCPDYLVLTRLDFSIDEKLAAALAEAPKPKPSTGAALFNVNQQNPATLPTPDFKEAMSVRIDGYAADYKTVSDFYRTCRDAGLFLDVRLRRTWRQTLRSEQLVYFEMTLNLNPETAYLDVNDAD